MKQRLFLIILIMAGCLLPGCAVGPDFKTPDMPVAIPENYQNLTNHSGEAFTEPDRWWKIFKDPELDGIVEDVIHNNFDIQKAAARVLEVRSIFQQTDADRYPSLNLNVDAERRRYASFNPLIGKHDATTSNSYNLSLPAAFEIDLWGRLARSTEAARAQLLAAHENRRTVVQTIVSQAVDLYFNMESIERRIQLTRQSIHAFQKSREIVKGRYRRGLASILDVRQVERTLARAEAQLPAFNAALGSQRQALFVLQGRYPATTLPRDHGPDYFKLPPEVPPGLPSELLQRRPDIAAADAILHAACAQIGVAKAARFPQINLTATFGYVSDDIDTLFDPASELWQIAAGGMAPLFNAGKLAAGQRGAEARYQQARINYSQTVLQAFAEVEGALLNRRELIDQRNRLLKYRDEATSTLEVADDRYARGLVDYLTVLDSQQVQISADLELISVEYELMANHVTLCRALGGGWDLRSAPEPASQD